MKKLLVGLAVLPLLAGVASAAQPMSLSDAQMDKVTAGQDSGLPRLIEEQTNFSTVLIAVAEAPIPCGSLCYLNAQAGFVSIQAAFGNVSAALGGG